MLGINCDLFAEKSMLGFLTSAGTLVEAWVQFLSPNHQISHHDPHVAASYSVCYPQKTLISSSVLPCRRYNHTIDSFMVWTLCLYGLSARHGRLMVLCPDNGTPHWMAILLMPRRLHWGAICSSSKHLFAPPRQYNITGMHHFGLASRWVQRKRNIGRWIHSNG